MKYIKILFICVFKIYNLFQFQSPVAITPNITSSAGAAVTTTQTATKLIQIRPQTQGL